MFTEIDSPQICKLFKQFTGSDVFTNGKENVFSENEMNEVQHVASIIHSGGCSSETLPVDWSLLSWEPKYGAAILACSIDTSSTEIHIYLIALDGWTFSADRADQASVAGAYSPLLYACCILKQRLSEYLDRVYHLLKISEENTGRKRSACNNDGGNQKTPSFLLAVCEAAHQSLTKNENDKKDIIICPRGGFTDVGQHTGNCERDVAYALFKACVFVILDKCSNKRLDNPWFLYEKLLAYFELWFTQSLVAAAESKKDIEEAWNAIVYVTQRLGPLMNSQYLQDVKILEHLTSKLEEFRLTLEIKISDKQKRAGLAYTLKPLDIQSVDQLQQIKLETPLLRKLTASELDINIAKKHAIENLDAKALIDDSMTWSKVFDWFKRNLENEDVSKLFVVESFEKFMLMKAPYLAKESQCLSKDEIKWLLHYLNKYFDLSNKVANDFTGSNGLMKTNIQSRKVLIAWLTYCFVHKFVCTTFPMCKEYKVVLKHESLKYLVLYSFLEMQCLQHVCDYIVEFNRFASKLPIFSGRSDEVGGTHQLADQMVQTMPDIQRIWKINREDANQRKNNRYQIIVQKQKNCKDLQAEIEASTAELEVHQEKMDNYEDYYHNRCMRNRCRSRIRTLEKQLDYEKNAPAPIFQPLPDDEILGLRALFFCYLPIELHYLSYAGYMAYSAFDVKVSAMSKGHDWVIHYNYYSSHSCPDPYFSLFTLDPPPRKWGETDVRRITDQCNGIWSPPSCAPMIYFRGDSNPFSLWPYDEIAKKFTEKSPGGFDWAYIQLLKCEQTTRSNEGYPKLKNLDNWIRKNQFLEFSTLRAYPHMQFRRLSTVLNDETLLPFDNREVHVLIRQLMYQIGDLSVEAPVKMLWKMDLLRENHLDNYVVQLSKLREDFDKHRRKFPLFLYASNY